MTRRPASSALLLAALAALAAPGSADARGGLLVSPARIDAEVREGSLLPAIRVRNGTGRALRLRAQVVVATQGLDGLPVRQPEVDAERELGHASPGTFLLRAGAERRVRVRITADDPLRGRGSYGVVVFTATDPAASGRSGRTTVATRLRLGANLLLRYPGPGHASGRATGLRAEQAGRRRLRFTVGVRNDGTLHGTPVSRLVVRRADGEVVVRRTFPSGAVLPRAEREFAVVPGRTLPAGTYTARATVLLGGRRSHRRIRFTLVGPGQLPTPDLEIAALPVPRPRPGQPVGVDLDLRNAGTAPAVLDGLATVGPLGGAPTQRLAIGGRPLAPGERRTAPLELEPVGPGAKELVIELRDGDRTVARRTLVFREAQEASLWDRFRDWAAGHIELLLAGFGLLLLLLLALLVEQQRRMRRRLRAAEVQSAA